MKPLRDTQFCSCALRYGIINSDITNLQYSSCYCSNIRVMSTGKNTRTATPPINKSILHHKKGAIIAVSSVSASQSEGTHMTTLLIQKIPPREFVCPCIILRCMYVCSIYTQCQHIRICICMYLGARIQNRRAVDIRSFDLETWQSIWSTPRPRATVSRTVQHTHTPKPMRGKHECV